VPEATRPANLLRFGVFELDLRAGELRKRGLKVRLQEKPQQLLALLLENPGEVVTREELRQRLWPPDTFVDFDHSLGTAINKLREALSDSAERPQFIETLPRHGYRFIAAVDSSVETQGPSEGAVPARLRRDRMRWLAAVAVAAIVVFATLFALNVAGLRDWLLSRVGASHGVPLPKIESIAVLPLENLSGDPAQEYFADGMTDALITGLGNIGALRVTSRTSVMRYKGTRKPLPEIGLELHADAVVEGAVLLSGDRVRVTVNLLHAPTDRHLWAATYERDLRDVLSLQDEVARAVAGQIRIKLTPQEQVRLTASRPVDPQALEAYLKGWFHWYRVTPEDLQTALEYFQLALQKDPNFAPAYAGMGLVWLVRGCWGMVAPSEAAAKGRKAVLGALELDNTLAEGYYVAAGFNFYYDWDWTEAQRGYQRAIQLNPNFADARAIYWDLLTTMKRPEGARSQIERAVELDPYNSFFHALLGQNLIFLHQDDAAIAQLRKSLKMDSGNSIVHRYLWGALHAKGLQEEALAEAKTYLEMMGNREAAGALTQGYAEGGYRQAMRLAAEALDAHSRQAYVPCLRIARLYAHAGETAHALNWLEKSFQEREPFMVSLNVDPFWDSLRSDPRFQDILRRMNFPH
jgi:TolB-like protein/DNA-binding winged helix-turn-helix (wHTH) protein/tetratricopeptide (TPR) repeat protein